jgi:hypothetical protein
MEYLSLEPQLDNAPAVSRADRWFSIGSIIAGAISVMVFSGLLCWAFISALQEQPWLMTQNPTLTIGMGFVVLCLAPFSFVGLFAGGIGAWMDRPRAWLGVLGIILNVCYLAAFALVMALGFANR